MDYANKEALKLPDPLLVRYYRESRIDQIQTVTQDNATLDVAVTLLDGSVEKWKHVSSWMPDVD